MKNISEDVDNVAAEGLIEDAGDLICNIFFINLHLHNVNGLVVPAKHRTLYLWTSMIWYTKLSGVNVISKRSSVSETVSNMVFVLHSYFLKCLTCTSKPA